MKRVLGSIVILCIIGSVFIVLFYQSKNAAKSKSTIQEKKISISQPIPIPTGSGDVNNPETWVTYTYNHDFGIAYPPFWNVVVDQDGNGVSFMTTGFHQDDDFSMPYGNSNEVVYTIFGQNDISDMKLHNGDQFPSDTTSETMVVTNLKHIQIDGYPAVEFDYYPTDNTNFLKTRVSVLKGNKIYRFNAIYAQDAGKSLFNAMMQTLKFM